MSTYQLFAFPTTLLKLHVTVAFLILWTIRCMNRMISEINLFSPRSDMLNWFLPQDIVKILVTGIFDVGIFNK